MRHSALDAEARIRKDWIPAFMGMTKSNNNFLETALAIDGHHINVAMLLGPNPSMIVFDMEADSQKFALWEKVASDVEVGGATAIIVTGEVFLEAEQGEPKKDALQVVGASMEGEVYLFREGFEEKNGEVRFVGDKVEGKLIAPGGFLSPIFDVWAKRGRASQSKRVKTVIGWAWRDKIEIALPWFLDTSLPCPCGSGKSFGECCASYLGKVKRKEEIDMKRAEEAERFYRSKLTGYIGYVYRDTLGLIKRAKDADWSILIKGDIEALDEIVNKLASVMHTRGKGKEILTMMDHISDFVPLPGLRERMLGLKAVWCEPKSRGSERVKKLLAVVDFGKISDRVLLQVYFQVFGGELSSEDRVKLIDKIIEGTEKPAELLQYTALKGFHLSLGGETNRGVLVIDKAIQDYGPLLEKERDVYSLRVRGDAFMQRWYLKGEEVDLNSALDCYSRIELGELNERGKAEAYKKMGDVYKRKLDFEKAIEYYSKAKQEESTQPVIIHLAEAYVRNGELVKGKEILEELGENEVEEVCRLEYLEVKGLIGQIEDNRGLMEETAAKAQALDIADPYFKDARERLCKELEMTLGNAKRVTEEGESA